MVLRPSVRIPRVPTYSGFLLALNPIFAYGNFTLFVIPFQISSANLFFRFMQVLTRYIFLYIVWALPISLAATQEIDVSFSSSGYLDVSVPRVPFIHLWIQCMMTGVLPAGFPHSDIRGSMDICSSPRLFAAYHVFRRLSVPRHPPCALSCLTFRSHIM